MTSFSEFLNSIYRDGNDGKQFERFVKWFLKHDPEWSTQVDEVWLWDEWPGKWGIDKGIDLVFRHRNGDIWAVQAKCYSGDYYITKADIDTFLSESNRKVISRRLLMASTDRIGDNAREVCAGQEKPVTHFLLSEFEKAAVDYPSDYKHLRSAKRKKKPTPHDYQEEAISAVAKGFKTDDRGQLIMACGTGKTFTTLWIKEQLKSQNTLVLLPSLNLLAQTVREWTFASKSKLDVLCVCSDQSVGRKRDDDEATQSVSDVPFPVTSSIADIRDFLKGSGDKVIFSTYQSSDLIADAQRGRGLELFDLAVADEAHRCAINGKPGSPFATILDDKRIKAKRRLFATATPRTYTASVKKAAEERGVEVVGMDDESVFGRQFHTLTFGEAIKHEPPLLTDYQVVIVGVDDAMIADWIESRELVTSEGSDVETDAETLAAQIGLLKTIKDYNLKRVISFHSRVKRAKDFAEDIGGAAEIVDKHHLPQETLRADFVSGKMSTSDRGDKLKKLKQIGADEVGLLANARCLSEGVDVPSLDGVAFIDPKNSQVDIIQAVGRAIRLSGNKTVGTIVLPVFIKDGEDAEERIEASNFKPIWWVLNALKAHDDVLVDELDAIRTEMGRRGASAAGSEAIPKIVLDLPTSVDASFADALKTHLVVRTTASWNFWFGLLERFVEQHNTAWVPVSDRAFAGYDLRRWTASQRTRKSMLTEDQTRQLEALPNWIWDVNDYKWEEGCSHLKDYSTLFKDTLVPRDYKSPDGYALGSWVSNQRTLKATLSSERKKLLEQMPCWTWDARAAKWELGFQHLQEYVDIKGVAAPPAKHKTPTGFNLGGWVDRQRQNVDGITHERKSRLEKLPGWTWEVLRENWELGYAQLLEYVELNGNALVPAEFVTKNGFKLGGWVRHKRLSKSEISSEQVLLLNEVKEWVWDVLEHQWQTGLTYLQEYMKKHGHSRVLGTFVTSDGFKLGEWVSIQRSFKNKMVESRRAQLEELLGWAWNVNDSLWEHGFQKLAEYVDTHGDAVVPAVHVTNDGHKLGIWVGTQRQSRHKMTESRRARLEAQPGWIWKIRKRAD
jgi:superfamily II DNA or RNA helicase